MKPVWAIQDNAVNRVQAKAVAFAVLANGGDVCGIEVLPSTNSINFLNDTGTNTKDLIPYGSTKLVELALEKGWTGVFRNDNFSVPVWNENHPDMLNRDSVNMLAQDIPEYTKHLPRNQTIFIRPTIGKKLFPGQITSVAEINNWLNEGRVGKFLFPPEMEVTLAQSKYLFAETRWFVVDGKVIDGSTYRLREQRVMIHENNESNHKEAQRLADIWLPHKTCAMDLVLTENGTKVVEFNTFNSSGFYHHDISKIVKAVHEHL